MKVCTVCKMDKPLFEYSPDKRIKSGVQSRCKPCYAQIMKERRAKDPEAHRDAVKNSTAKHYQKKLQRNNEYRKNNPHKVKQWKRKDRLVNKPRVLADNARRRGWTRGETSPEVEQLYALRDFYKSMSLGEEFHVDHIQPLSKGGLHVFSNMQVIPAIDNLRKGAK